MRPWRRGMASSDDCELARSRLGAIARTAGRDVEDLGTRRRRRPRTHTDDKPERSPPRRPMEHRTRIVRHARGVRLKLAIRARWAEAITTGLDRLKALLAPIGPAG